MTCGVNHVPAVFGRGPKRMGPEMLKRLVCPQPVALAFRFERKGDDLKAGPGPL
jgi:hypothetical protein